MSQQNGRRSISPRLRNADDWSVTQRRARRIDLRGASLPPILHYIVNAEYFDAARGYVLGGRIRRKKRSGRCRRRCLMTADDILSCAGPPSIAAPLNTADGGSPAHQRRRAKGCYLSKQQEFFDFDDTPPLTASCNAIKRACRIEYKTSNTAGFGMMNAAGFPRAPKMQSIEIFDRYVAGLTTFAERGRDMRRECQRKERAPCLTMLSHFSSREPTESDSFSIIHTPTRLSLSIITAFLSDAMSV